MTNPWAFWSAETIASVTGCPVENVKRSWPLIADSLDRRKLYSRDVCLGVLPTVAIETASSFQPIHEYGTPADWTRYEGGAAYAGRGFPQVTHLSNYRAAGEALGVDLVSNPNLALDPAISADILAWFWATKGVPSKDRTRYWTLADLCRERDWEWVRRVFQGGTDGLERLISMATALDAVAPPEVQEPVMAANDAYRVADGPARLRVSPSTTATIVKELPAGTAVLDVGDPMVDADGHQWRRVALGPVGWMADGLLAKSVAKTPTDLPPGRYTFDPTAPTERQLQPWTCAIRSTMWMLKSIGIPVTPDEAQDAMSPAYVNEEVGLLDASGAGIVEVLRDHWGVTAHNVASLSFDEAMSLAGTGPLAIGLHNWGGPSLGHWTAVRGKADGALVLANPAGTGPIYGQQTLSRQEYDSRGPASGVFIPV